MNTLLRLETRRLLSAGEPDLQFGNNGIVFEPTPIFAAVNDTETLQGDQILLAGGLTAKGSDGPDYFFRRFNADGTPDTAFGGDGTVTGRFTIAGAQILQTQVAADGRIMALAQEVQAEGSHELHRIVARFNADGSLDTTFNDDGFFSFPDVTSTFAVQDDGNILIASRGVLMRYTPAGAPDAGFGANGGVSPLTGIIYAVHPLPDGKILVGGIGLDDAGDNRFGLTKLNSDGSPDTAFNHGDPVITQVSSALGDFATDEVDEIVVLPDGKIIAGGAAAPGYGAVRYNANGSLDTSFGDGGIRFTEFGPPQVQLGPDNLSLVTFFRSRAIVDDTGRVYLVGASGGQVTRLTSDGDIDESFGAVFGGFFHGGGAALLSSGRLVLTGNSTTFNPQTNAVASSNIVLVGRLTTDSTSPITLTSGTLSIAGTGGKDRIEGQEFEARDVIVSLNGFGRVFRSDDVNLISAAGGAGNDEISMPFIRTVPCQLSGGDGRDKITGGSLNDTLNGNADRDFIDGGDGADLIAGNGGSDQLRGQGGADRIHAGAGNDYLEGGGGNDRLYGDLGADLLIGNAGNDSFFTNDATFTDSLFGDGGNDSADADTLDVMKSIEVS